MNPQGFFFSLKHANQGGAIGSQMGHGSDYLQLLEW